MLAAMKWLITVIIIVINLASRFDSLSCWTCQSLCPRRSHSLAVHPAAWCDWGARTDGWHQYPTLHRAVTSCTCLVVTISCFPEGPPTASNTVSSPKGRKPHSLWNQGECCRGNTPDDITYTWNLKYDTNEHIHETGTDSDTENRLWLPGGRGWGKDEWEVRVSRCKLLSIGWTNRNVLLYSTENCIHYSMINHNRKGYFKKRMYIYIYMFNRITLLFSSN